MQGEKKDDITLSSSTSVSLEVAVSHTKCVGWPCQKSEGGPSTIPIAACCWSMCCEIQTVTTAKMGTEHHRLCDSVSAHNHLHRCHVHFIKTSACSASVLMGREKSRVSQMCRAQTVKQVIDQRNSLGAFTVKDGTNVVPSWGNQTDSDAYCRTGSGKASDTMWNPGLLRTNPFKLNPI